MARFMLLLGVVFQSLLGAQAGDDILYLECKARSPQQTIHDIQAVNIVIDDHIQEYAHVETINFQGTATWIAEFDLRRGSQSDLDLGTFPAEGSMMDNVRLITVGEEHHLVNIRTTPERGQSVTTESYVFDCK